MNKSLIIVLILIVIVMIAAMVITNNGAEPVTLPPPVPEEQHISIRVGETTLRALVVDTPEERAQGLSGRAGLEEDEVMLFVFEEADRHAFWMKDMLFSIDIFWLDEKGAVVHLKEDVTPDTFPTTFAPSSKALYAVEANAGFADQHDFKEGTQWLLPDLQDL